MRKLVTAESVQATNQEKMAEQMKLECEEALAIALPELDSAVEALKTLKKDDITEVKGMTQPPDGVRLTMEAIAIFNKEKPLKLPDPNDKSRLVINW